MYQSIHTGEDIDSCIVLSKVTENHKQGLRLLSSNSNRHGNIGLNAIDLSHQSEISEITGASGDYSVCLGLNTTASALYSFSTGLYNIGLQNTLVEVGSGNSQWDRKNAFEIYLDGRVRAPGLILSKINTAKSLATKEYVDLHSGGGGGGGGNLYSDGSVLMDADYVPAENLSIATKEYADSIDGGAF